jgi:hypothetical protein
MIAAAERRTLNVIHLLKLAPGVSPITPDDSKSMKVACIVSAFCLLRSKTPQLDMGCMLSKARQASRLSHCAHSDVWLQILQYLNMLCTNMKASCMMKKAGANRIVRETRANVIVRKTRANVIVRETTMSVPICKTNEMTADAYEV